MYPCGRPFPLPVPGIWRGPPIAIKREHCPVAVLLLLLLLRLRSASRESNTQGFQILPLFQLASRRARAHRMVKFATANIGPMLAVSSHGQPSGVFGVPGHRTPQAPPRLMQLRWQLWQLCFLSCPLQVISLHCPLPSSPPFETCISISLF